MVIARLLQTQNIMKSLGKPCNHIVNGAFPIFMSFTFTSVMSEVAKYLGSSHLTSFLLYNASMALIGGFIGYNIQEECVNSLRERFSKSNDVSHCLYSGFKTHNASTMYTAFFYHASVCSIAKLVGVESTPTMIISSAVISVIPAIAGYYASTTSQTTERA